MRRTYNDREATSERDRRACLRFPLRLAIKYRRIGSREIDWTATESVNISSSGVLFASAEAIQLGQSIEALVSWPVFLDKHIPLKLVVKGHIVRNAEEGSAMNFATYEFRTSPSAPGGEQ